MADRICVESSDYIIPTVLFVLSSQFQLLFVWRECLGIQVLIVLTAFSFRFSHAVPQSRRAGEKVFYCYVENVNALRAAEKHLVLREWTKKAMKIHKHI